MKYQYHNQPIPQEARKELNEKILYLVDQDLAAQSGISCEDIFNAYTGDGGLHGLNRSDFDNYHEFSEAKKEIENGQFFTPPALCRFVMEALQPGMDETVADLTSGIANFCNFMPIEANFYGCELDIKSHKVAHYLYPAANLEHRDIRYYNPNMRFDYVVGNPPFNLKWDTDQGEYLSQMYYCVKAAQLLKPLGIMAIVVPSSFLADEFLDHAKISELEKDFSFLGQVSIPAGAFKYLGVSNFPTSLMFWQKKLNPEDQGNRYDLTEANCFSMVALENTSSLLNTVRQNVVAPAKERMQRDRSRAKLALHSGNDSDFHYQVQKMLYQIKSNPKIRDKYAKCQEYLYRFEHQVMPENMKYKEWAKIRITEAKVLAYLRRTVRSQHTKPTADVVKMVKRDHEIVFKAYSRKVLPVLQKLENPGPIHRLVTEGEIPENLGEFARVIRRKQRQYHIETMPFEEMSPDPEIAQFLDTFMVYDLENEEEIHLNDRQKSDINLILQKQYHLLQWEQGSGKTLAGIAVGMYRMRYQHARNTWVVSTAISINNNWDEVLSNYSLPYRMVTRLKDLERVQDGEYVIITMNMLTKYRKHIKRHIKSRNQNICLVLDESDEMTNPNSKRTKAILDCFRRVKFKLAMTGTVTRNNISEAAPQLELLYNNSYNMISWAETLYHYDKDSEGERYLEVTNNPYYGSPIPAYKPGYTLFSQSHLPEKITVFGVGKRSQDIYNADVLSKILSYSVITRTFEEITGKDIRRIHQVPVKFSPAEYAVYNQAIEEFYTMRSRYFASTGNSRKDSMMALIQQITLLLRISAAPNTVEEYHSNDTPVKIAKVMDMLEENSEEIVVIGVRHKNVVESYAEEIRARFPNRSLFVVTGSTTTLTKRRALRKTLRASGNGILLCTQQSLPSSVNFEFVNKIIIPELHFNNARMSQFYHRFIRFTSVDWKDIYFVTYGGSIESNQMQMVLSKERLNLFMKGQDVDLDEIYDRFGVDYDLMSLLMSREEDENGKFQITWGQQKIS